MSEEVMVSVSMTVYNHEEYIEHAIQSVVMQKVNFKFEFLIGEDCSPDHSYDICKKYADQYPDIIRFFHREQNIGVYKNRESLWDECRGKYLIHVEGDDYWTDETKLQKQVDFLESHPEYIACAHKFHVVDRYENVYYDRDFEIQFKQENPYSIQDFEEGRMLSHMNSILFRNFVRDHSIDWSFWRNRPEEAHLTGDTTLTMLLALHGDIYCLDEYMSCYRKVTDADTTSHSAMQEYNNTRNQKFYAECYLEQIFGKQVDFTQRKKNIYASTVFKWYRDRSTKNFKVIQKVINMSGHKVQYTMWFVYLVTARWLLNHTGRKDQRVSF